MRRYQPTSSKAARPTFGRDHAAGELARINIGAFKIDPDRTCLEPNAKSYQKGRKCYTPY
jgi:hypothetical protein